MTKTSTVPAEVVEARRTIAAAENVFGDAPEGSTLHDVRLMFERDLMDLQHVERSIRSAAKQVASDLDRVQRYLAEGYGMNPSGMFHSSARNFDALCVEQQSAWSKVIGWLELANRLHDYEVIIDVEAFRAAMLTLANA